MGRELTLRVRHCDQCLTLWRTAATTEEGTVQTQMDGKSVRRLDLGRNLYLEATADKAGRQTSMKERPTRSIRVWTRMLRLRWGVGAVEKLSARIPLHLPLQSHRVGHPTVRKEVNFGRCF